MYNRNKYMEDLNQYKGQELKQMGIAYIDLNGLKQVNDSHSHTAGDLYIQNAAKVITSIFTESCYRIGGDEFVILAVGMKQDEFLDKIEELREEMQKAAVSIAIGFSLTRLVIRQL